MGALTAAARRRRRRRSTAAAGRRSGAGFTLVELLVATALAALALALAAGLLAETQRRFAAAAREQLDPLPALALAQLRADLQGAAGVGGRAYRWGPVFDPHGPLELTGHPAGGIRYQLLGGDLVRTVRDPAGDERSRLLLRGVSSWSWRVEAPGLLTVEIGSRRHFAAQLRAAGAARPAAAAPPPAEERATITVALRGGGRAQRW